MSGKNEVVFEVMPDTLESARFVYEIRASESVQQYLFNRTSTFEEFQKRFFLSFQIPSLPPLIIRQDNTRVGYITFRPIKSYNNQKARAVEISIGILPEFHGQGIATKALKELEALRFDCDEIWALIHPENKASVALFTKAGYKPYGRVEHVVWGMDTSKSYNVEGFCKNLHTPGVFIIAEVGSNWRIGSIEHDLDLVRQYAKGASSAGCNAIKFQTFHPDRMYAKGAGTSAYLSQSGISEDMGELFKKLQMPHEVIPTIARICSEERIEFMSTPFSEEDFDAVDPYVKRHKIASYELSHSGLLQRAAKSGKPLFLSTGAATLQEIEWALRALGDDVTLMQCTAAYPAPDESMNLNAIETLRSAFQKPCGLSDHSPDPFSAPLAAVALRAAAIEKHVTIDRGLPGPDHAFSITLEELAEMVHRIRMVEAMIGSGVKEPQASEDELFHFAKRRIQTTRKIRAGEIFRLGDNIAILRPGSQPAGAHPSALSLIEGKVAKRELDPGQGVTLHDI